MTDIHFHQERKKFNLLKRLPRITKRPFTSRKAVKDVTTAGTAARNIYRAIAEVIETSHDPSFQHRLHEAMHKVVLADKGNPPGKKELKLANLKRLRSMRIFKNNAITVKTKVKRNRSGTIDVFIQQPGLQAPAAVTYIEYRAVAVCPDYRHRYSRILISNPYILSKAEELPDLTLELQSASCRPCLVILEARAYKMRGGNLLPVDFTDHNAADIIAVLPAVKKIVLRRKDPKVSEKTAEYWNYVSQRKGFGGMQQN
ncbi:hypothetical protein MKQ68_12495 [Chitinophaga horti]|uniref:Uncharacterized protein n=1 Tax=Chitinophaga horti TaxID=2920382 RepID=A0ABY6J8V9_9BACT|nr:hypothetical protein [Chitinophaga horti]UYQ95920.1 hypothetical protein MKQ68_12495 [Chitinophaga horti]